jgi:tetratricopeptide (TPR) repeat protein
MTDQLRIVTAFICLFSLLSGCAHIPGGPPDTAPPAAEAPRDESQHPENAYFYFLAAQQEQRAGQLDKAVLLLRKALESEPDSPYLERELATVYIQNKEDEKAIAVLERLIAKHPGDVKGLILYGGVLQGRKQTDAALRAYEKVLVLDPTQEKIYTLVGGLYLEANDMKNAERVLLKMVEQLPNSFMGHYLLGRLYLETDRPALAEKAFWKSAEADSDSIEPLFELLKLAREKGRREDVLRISREILKRDPDNSRAHLELALYYRQAGMQGDSEAILRQLGERSRTEFEVVLQVIQGYVDPKKFEDSLYLLDGMLKSAPENPELHHLKAFSLFGLKKNTEALPEFRKVTATSRFYQDAVVHIAFILQEQGKIDEAVAHLNSIIQENPENADLRYYLASVYEEARNFEEAERLLLQAIEKDPRNARYYFRLGVVYDKQKKKNDCIEAMRKAIELDPKDATALNYLGYTYADLGQNLDEAERLVLEALKYKPNDGYITDSLGWVYYQKGNYEKALQHLKKASELANEDPVILEHIGDTYLKLNDKTNALKYYQQSMSKREKEKSSDPEKAKEKEDLKLKIRRVKEGAR